MKRISLRLTAFAMAAMMSAGVLTTAPATTYAEETEYYTVSSTMPSKKQSSDKIYYFNASNGNVKYVLLPKDYDSNKLNNIVEYDLYGNKATARPKLPAPTEITGTSSSDSITLEWDAVSGADAYKVYKYNSSTKKLEKYKTVSAPSCKVTGLKPNTTYIFKVSALDKVNGGYKEGSMSEQINAMTQAANITPPSAGYSGMYKSSGSYYYFKNGKPVKGFVNISGDVYFFDAKTYVMRSGWIQANGKQYYFMTNGKMAVDTVLSINGRYCVFDEKGVYQGLSKDEQDFVDTVCPYLTAFKDPSSVKIVGNSVYKFTNTPVQYVQYSNDYRSMTIKENGKISGYVFDISATNGFGARNTYRYVVITKSYPSRYAPYIGSYDEDKFGDFDFNFKMSLANLEAYIEFDAIEGHTTKSRHNKNISKSITRIPIDNAKVNEEAHNYLEDMGY